MSEIVFSIPTSEFLSTDVQFNNLLLQQWEEVDDRRKTSELNVQWDSYKASDEAGMHVWLLAVEYDEAGFPFVKGYISLFLCPSMHTGELTALTDTMYVVPSERGTGLGSELIAQAEKVIKEKGAKHFMVTFKNDVNHAPLAERLGLFNYETVYCKAL